MIKEPQVVFALVALYLLAVFASGLYVFYREAFAPKNGEFAGFGIVVLTLPWRMVLAAGSESGRAARPSGTSRGCGSTR